MQFKSLEITSQLPCINNCCFCPRDYLKENYKGNRKLDYDTFKTIIDKVPTEVRIDFSGMSEPFGNNESSLMMKQSHITGHSVSLFTTLVGLRDSDMDNIKDLPFSGICIHAPDSINFKTNEDIWIENFLKFTSVFKDYSVIFHVGNLSDKVYKAMDSRITTQSVVKGGVTNKHIPKSNVINTIKKCPHSTTHEHNVLLPNGDVYLCCMDYGLESKIGNLIENDYESLNKNKSEYFTLCLGCECR